VVPRALRPFTEKTGAFFMEKLWAENNIVIKIGSSSLTNNGAEINHALMEDLARQISIVKDMGYGVSVVTSGAIACGKLEMGNGNTEEVHKQVLAAVGQRPLLNAWGQAFDKYNIKTGLFLFAESDLDKPSLPLRNALSHGIVPIINANDTVSVDEIRQLAISADNDRLASYVAKNLVFASKLILLTESSGVWDVNRQVIDSIDSETDLLRIGLFNKTSVGTGGIESKIIEARRFIDQLGKQAYIAGAGDTDVIIKIMKGDSIGTKVTLPL
jgi:glutamate 5-kinase